VHVELVRDDGCGQLGAELEKGSDAAGPALDAQRAKALLQVSGVDV
jgi:hypothetical protein